MKKKVMLKWKYKEKRSHNLESHVRESIRSYMGREQMKKYLNLIAILAIMIACSGDNDKAL